MNKLLTRAIVAFCTATVLASTALAGDLIINFDDPNPGPKKGFEDAVAEFKAAHPKINVTVKINSREVHTASIDKLLSSNTPDVISWYPGNRMAPFVKAGQFEDISNIWSRGGLDKSFAAIKPTMTIGNKQWGIPYTYYHWGIYYRKDIFKKLKITEPKNWEELLEVCKKLKKNGVTPFTIGTKYLWTTAGIFDYLNLRINGYEVHSDLTRGKIRYSDPRIRATFAKWKKLIEMGAFLNKHDTMSWLDAVKPFANGKAAMYVMGNFSIKAFKDAGLTYDQIDYFPFPEITPGVPRAEEAPADAFFIPTKAKNKREARKFLAFISNANIQSRWNATIAQLPPNSKAAISDDKFIQNGFKTVSTAKGLTQYYDRDVPKDMAKAGLEGFQEFMLKPDNLEKIIERLDEVQTRVYN